jgi:hypothetical protein
MNRNGIALLLTLLCGCNHTLTRRGPIDPGLAAYILPDTIALVGVNMDRLRVTPLYRKLAAQNRVPLMDQFRADDIHDVLIAGDAKNLLAIARGSFPAKSGVFTMADPHTALAGSDFAVKAALAQAKSGGHGAPRDLMARADAVPAGSQIWAVVIDWPGMDPATLQFLGNFANLDRILRSVVGATLTVDASTGMRAEFTGDCQTEGGAGSLADSLRGLTSLARVGVARKQPDLARALDGIQVRQEGRVVRMNIDLTEDLAEKLADKIR